MSEFHWQDGWYFKRLGNGSVQVQKRRVVSKDTRFIEAEAVIPAAEWASIVASVTVHGDNAITYQLATILHQHKALDNTPLAKIMIALSKEMRRPHP